MRIEVALRHRFRDFALDAAFASDGPVTGIFGPSGSGKSTLLHLIAGLIPSRGATVRIDGESLTGLPPERRRAALVPQDPLLFPHRSTLHNLTYAQGARAALASRDGERILDVLRLGALLERRPSSLSGGERQRVALGRALLARPRVLLLDEPTSSLDVALARDVLALLGDIRRAFGTLMLFVTHRANELVGLADDCVVLDGGRLVAQGPPMEVLARPRTLGVAHLAGVDNRLALPVAAHAEADGLSWLDLGGARLAVPLADAAVGTEVRVGVRADDVLLCRTAPSGISARNVLSAVVRSIDRAGHDVLVRVAIGGTDLLVRITPGALAELALQPEDPIVVVLKSSACHILDA